LASRLRRLEISAFVVFHLAALTVGAVPACPVKDRLLDTVLYYLMPTGQGRHAAMAVPEPIRDTVVTLEAEVLDSRGLTHVFSFPRESNPSPWDPSWNYRHARYLSNLALKDDFKAHREFAARHAIRQLRLPREAFPVEVCLMHQIKPSPPPGILPDPMVGQTPSVIESYRFPTLEEALP
jgi:hypothetical protein